MKAITIRPQESQSAEPVKKKSKGEVKMNRARKKIIRKVESEKDVDFTSVPTATLCSSIQLLVDELNRRGESLHDFDDKEKILQQIRILDRPYFLAAKEGTV